VLARADYVRRACVDRPGLRERLHEIALAVSASDPAAKPSPVPSSVGDRVRAMELAFAPQESASTTIGPYKLLQKIGEGGFGVVWMAEQQEPVRRRVALKVIKSGMDTREVIARFEAERQALALMDHPNIARVFDAGATDTGRPYFVMELVRGIPITRYCDENRVPTEARLNLFIAVCHAVQHAHQKGIIHRDLKPSNIIVTLHDGVPVPKIIDFGIAKATETQLTQRTLFTQFHAFIGTPAYTSPEQMEMSGLDVDTRSDIYSLGVLLYELLAGKPPFDPDALMKSGLEEMRRTIREVDPQRPSHRLRTFSKEIRTTVARQRGTDAARLSLLLRGDLDWIVMHCLEKDRTRRYDTANALAADVRNYLNDETVSARPPSAGDRLHKFIRRHKLGFAAGAAIAVSLIAGLVTSSVLLVGERTARERAVAAEATQSGLRQKSAQVAQFMTEMLNGVGPGVALGRDTKLLRDILDATARRLDTELRDQPAVAADLRDTLGAVYCDLGEYTIAEKLLRAAVATHRTYSGNNSAETATSLHHLGVANMRLGKAAEAETALREALAIRRKLFGNEHPAVADTLYQLAFVPDAHRSAADRRSMMEEALAICRHAHGEEHPEVARAIAGLGYVAQMALDHESGARLHAEALAMRRRLLGNEHPDVAASLDALGYSCAHTLDRKSDAAAAYGEAFAIRRKMLGDQHPKMVVSLLRFTGQKPARDVDPETLAVVRGFVASQRRLLPHDSALLGPSLLALASLEDLPDRHPDEAQDLRREAHALLETSRSNGTPLDAEVIDAMFFFGWSKFIANVPAEGLAMCEETLKLAHAAFGADGRATFFPTHTLAWLYLGMGRQDEAALQFEAAVRLGRNALGENHAITLVDLAALGACYRVTNRVAESHRLLETALSSYETEFGKASGSPHVASVMCQFGLTFVREAEFAEAEAMLRRALAHYDHPEMIPLGLRLHPRPRAVSGLGQALAGQGKFAEAEPLVVQAFEELQANEQRIAGDRSGVVRDACDAVIALYTAWGKPEKVAEWKQKIPLH
jgi:eukaryotic-like serine/threonine-protein kinase